jgi:hypothetical protein
MKPGKPYRQRRMTAANSAIHVDQQIKRYAMWAASKDLDTIHIFPPRKSGYSRWAYEALLEQPLKPELKLVEVNPEDYK